MLPGSGALGPLGRPLLLLEGLGLGLLSLGLGLLAQGLDALAPASLLGITGLLKPVVADHGSDDLLGQARNLVPEPPQVGELHVSDPHDEVTLLAFSGTWGIYPRGPECKLLLANAYHEHRAGSVVEHVVADRAQQHPLDHAVAVGADDDEVVTAILGLATDLRRRVAVQHPGGGVAAEGGDGALEPGLRFL